MKDHATVGDALIFTVKAVGTLGAAVIVVIAVAVGAWWWDKWSYSAQLQKAEEALVTEQALSRETLNQVDLLNRQKNALRVQLAALEQQIVAACGPGSSAVPSRASRVEQALRNAAAAHAKAEERAAELGDKLNICIAAAKAMAPCPEPGEDCEPWERNWPTKELPLGFVIDEPWTPPDPPVTSLTDEELLMELRENSLSSKE
jgi:hypothetical protein